MDQGMLDSFLTFINQFRPALTESRTLLAVSGGIDSVVMVNLFHKAGLEAGIAHCNFGLRGDESEKDEVFVKELATACGYEFHTTKFDTKVYAKRNGLSTQMAARNLRYEWFEQIRIDDDYAKIATAHHLNDSLETSLLNLVRGTGLSGLKGMTAETGRIIRPLLFATRDEIERYLQSEGLAWREDSSNISLDYKRNVVRHKVVPVLKGLNRALENTFAVTSEKVEAASHILASYLDDWAKSVVVRSNDGIKIPMQAIMEASEPVYRLWYILEEFGFNYQQVQAIWRALGKESGRIFLSDRYKLLIDRDYMILSEIVTLDEQPVVIESADVHHEVIGFRELSAGVELKSDNRHVAVFDRDQLVFPLTIRRWEQGDKIAPLGMNGRRKKVSDILIDKKMDLFEKEHVKVLINGDGEVIWLIGIRISEKFKITNESIRALECSYKQDEF